MTHILAEVAKLASTDDRMRMRLIKGHDAALMRLDCADHNLWVMGAAEDGSVLDRWSNDSGRRLVKLTPDQIAKGSPSVYAHLLTLAGVS